MKTPVIIFAALLAVGAGVALFLLRRPTGAAPEIAPAATEPAASSPAKPQGVSTVAPPPESSADGGAGAQARRAIDELVAVLGKAGTTTPEAEARLRALESQLLTIGEPAAALIAARLDEKRDSQAGTEFLFHVLRRLPGKVADERIAHEARTSQDLSLRSMAIEALGRRASDQSIAVLEDIVKHDTSAPNTGFLKPEQPKKDDEKESEELPDEDIYTPRMKAVVALGDSKHPRSAAILADVVVNAGEPLVRLVAAEQLAGLRDQQVVGDALATVTTVDPSAPVRLAALKALAGDTPNPSLKPLLQRLEAQDPSSDVRATARQLRLRLPTPR